MSRIKLLLFAVPALVLWLADVSLTASSLSDKAVDQAAVYAQRGADVVGPPPQPDVVGVGLAGEVPGGLAVPPAGELGGAVAADCGWSRGCAHGASLRLRRNTARLLSLTYRDCGHGSGSEGRLCDGGSDANAIPLAQTPR